MDFDPHWIWWILAIALLIGEITSGTFYLLTVALGLGIAGLVAYLGHSWQLQSLAAIISCATGIAYVHNWKRKHACKARPSEYAGHSVTIIQWHGDGTARVSYRGTEWDAEIHDSAAKEKTKDSQWHIKKAKGSCLIIE